MHQRQTFVMTWTCGIALGVFSSVLMARDFEENWNEAEVRSYSLKDLDLVAGNDGKWILGATVDGNDHPDDEWPCGPTPHTVEIIQVDGEKELMLTSGHSNGGCADNVWVALMDASLLGPSDLNKGFSIPLNPGTFIAFEADGELEDPQTAPWGTQDCLVPPCYDNISIQMEVTYDDMRDIADLGLTEDDLWGLSNEELMDVMEYLEGGIQPCMLAYVLRCNPDAELNTAHSTYREIRLNPDNTFFLRNLYDDFSTIPAFTTTGARITSIEFSIDEHGWGVIDDLYIGTDNVPDPPAAHDDSIDLAEIIAVWDHLPGHVRAAIKALVQPFIR